MASHAAPGLAGPSVLRYPSDGVSEPETRAQWPARAAHLSFSSQQFYDQNEARKYVRNSRMIDIQTKMTERALELLCLPEGRPSYLLDIGCGSGLSGDYISEEGHYWVGIDISPAMLASQLFSGYATQTRGRTSLPGASTASFLPYTLSSSMGPEPSCSCTLRTQSRFYLCLFSGPSTSLPKGLTESQDADRATESIFTSERAPHKKARRDLVKKSREWVLEKKERRRRQGKEVRPDTQYTGRKRKPRF
ncbi:hypothetical protein A6R68_11070 [Neotoma lepida]|uniref:Uncharacterized protein n=1 Tax=Neotoma lepida TaxID=56216 RepID=A0A1A6FXA2_NEOLE|nr:hypothetical protein A6R68_11070 [Neotoma lepida]